MGRSAPDKDGFPVRMDRNQAALYLGVTVKTLERWRTQGRLPVGAVIKLPSGSEHNIAPLYRYDRNKLEAWLTLCSL